MVRAVVFTDERRLAVVGCVYCRQRLPPVEERFPSTHCKLVVVYLAL